MTDHIMAMLLSLARQLPRMEQYMRTGRFRQARVESTQLQRLSTCALGIVGFGATGENGRPPRQGLWPPSLGHAQEPTGVPYQSDFGQSKWWTLETLLAESDFVSLQVPLNADTYHMFDEALLRKMKPGSYLIKHVSRRLG